MCGNVGYGYQKTPPAEVLDKIVLSEEITIKLEILFGKLK